MAPTKKSATTSTRASRTTSTTARTATAKKATAKRATAKRGTTAPKKAARAVKKAAEPVTRAARAAQRTATGTPGSASSRSKGPDAIAVLTEDHRRVEDLFARFEKTGDGALKRRQDLVERITEALSMHASIEEDIFYPAARRFVAAAGDDVLEALEEHHLVKTTLAELESMDPSNERYRAKVTVLIENVRHHVEEEEGELFPT